MLSVRIQTVDHPKAQQPRDALETRILREDTYVTRTIGIALDQHAPDPAKGGEFVIRVLDRDVQIVEG